MASCNQRNRRFGDQILRNQRLAEKTRSKLIVALGFVENGEVQKSDKRRERN